MRELAILSLALLAAACGGGHDCPGGGPHPPQGSSADVTPLAEDAGYFLLGPSDAGVSVFANGLPLRPACHWADAGGFYVQYPDAGYDFIFDDGGLVDGDGGCHRTERLSIELSNALTPLGFTSGAELQLDDGGVIEQFGFRDWKNVNPAVQAIGEALVRDGLYGPVDLVPVTEFVGCD